MAYEVNLWFEALRPFLEEEHPVSIETLAKFVDHGTREFREYLQNAKKYQESTSIAAAWRLAKAASDGNGAASATPRAHGRSMSSDDGKKASTEEDVEVWVELLPPPDDRGRFDRDVLEFFSDYANQVYEASKDRSNAFRDDNLIEIIDVDENTRRILLEREPSKPLLLLRRNTYSISCQIRALTQLKNAPRRDHLPLLQLLGPAHPRYHSIEEEWSTQPMEWPEVESVDVDKWFILAEELEGVKEQREFVRKALGTPDFAILEGPPGSGKTTVICELILQQLAQDKRILLCASTHVAVDNVLERLTAKDRDWAKHVLPVRIGDKRRVSEQAAKFQLDTLAETIQKQVTRHLTSVKKPRRAQELMLHVMNKHQTLKEMILDCANIVCGTTIGILQHPQIKEHRKRNSSDGVTPLFDMLIIDEASKTTFQEFLVPALLAKRWVLVGDPRQLSPFIDDGEVAINVHAAMPDQDERNVCLDVFDNRRKNKPHTWKPVAVVSKDDSIHSYYRQQADKYHVEYVDADTAGDDPLALYRAPILLASTKALSHADLWPLDLLEIRGADQDIKDLRSRVMGYATIADIQKQNLIAPDRSWESEIAWRKVRIYEHRLFDQDDIQGNAVQRYDEDIECLLPAFYDKMKRQEVKRRLDDISRLAFPSVLESLQKGVRRPDHVRPTTLTDGLADDVLRERHTMLSYQRRMHPDISRFPREHIYKNEALRDAEDMARKREWGDGLWSERACWMDVPTRTRGESKEEADAVIEYLRRFVDWAARHPRRDESLWEVALLTFYRQQERVLRGLMKRESRSRFASRRCVLSKEGRDIATVQVCTVDRFQGHEADLVILSIASGHPTSFLECPNRINVAVTRARYQLVIVGNRRAMKKSSSSVLGKLANSLSHGFVGHPPRR